MKLFSTLSKITRQRLLFATLAIFSMLVFGTVGFRFFEGWNWLDSFYMATETVTTVGYGDIPPQTRAGRAFAIVFMLLGAGTVLYALTVLAQSVIQSEIVEALDFRRKTREMDKINFENSLFSDYPAAELTGYSPENFCPKRQNHEFSKNEEVTPFQGE